MPVLYKAKKRSVYTLKSSQLQQGFTLVEIAIVLVIIGLLLGATLKGRELLENTKLKSAKAEADAISTAILGYQDRYSALPGDDPAVVNHVSGVLATTPNNAQGNALIEGNFNTTTATDESFQVWNHLRLAGFYAGDSAVADGNAPQPINSFGGVTGIASNVASTSGLAVCHTGMPAEQMKIFDTRYDDGVVDKGSIRGITGATGGVDADYDNSTAAICVVY